MADITVVIPISHTRKGYLVSYLLRAAVYGVAQSQTRLK